MLREIIIEQILHEGPRSFCDFMETALYHPDLGYYFSPHNKIGREGDYYTSPNLTPLFGALLGRQIEEMWELSGKESFTIVEFGAGTGKMCHDILQYLETNPRLYRNLNYYIIEKSPAMRQIEEELLCDKVQWLGSINEIPPFIGCVISNELLDNFAVHRVVMKEQLMEVFVNYCNGFEEILLPARQELLDYLKEQNITLPKDFRTEINLEARQWLKDIAAAIKNGYIITIDYGHTASELYAPKRCNGTLMCYKSHTTNQNPFTNIGSQDITAHVNFSALVHFGAQCGLEYCGLTTQADFLLGLGFTSFVRACENSDTATEDYEMLYRKLITEMGPKFKVLIQSKGKNQSKSLLGLRVNRIPHSSLLQNSA